MKYHKRITKRFGRKKHTTRKRKSLRKRTMRGG